MRTQNGQPWYVWARRWGQTNLTEDDPQRNNIEFWEKQWERTHTQGVIVNCGGIVAYYPSQYGLQYRAATLGDGDYFKVFADAAARHGIVVVARMDINRATPEFYQAHPEWFCMKKDGTPYFSQGRYFSCVNSDYYKKYIPDVLTEIIERYAPVGFADNSWRGLPRDQICYCPTCKKLFWERTGRDLPEGADWKDPAYREWVRWGYECRTANWDLFNETTKRAGGEDCLWLGMLHASPTSNGFSDLKKLCGRSKVIFSDHQSRDMLNGFEQNNLSGALLRLASEENVVVPESWANYVRGDRTFRLAANPWQETHMWMASGIAGGISPWFHHIGGGTRDRRQFETPVPLFSWHAQNEEYLYDRKSLANVAVVWSQENADFYGRAQVKERVALPWRGVTGALSEARIPFLPINAADIGRYRDRYQTLVLPDIAILTGTQIDEICSFAQAGGNLVLSGITGTLDDDGNPHGNTKLWDMLGLSFTGRVQGSFVTQPSNWEYPLAHTYLHLGKTRHEIYEGFEDTEIIGFGGGLHEMETKGPLSGQGGYVMPFPIYPPEFSWIREINDGIHPIYAGTLASGSRVVYFAADIDRCYGRDRLPDHCKLIENAVRWASHNDLPMHVNGNGYIDTAIYQKGGKRIVHLVNLSGCNENPGYCHRLLPIGGITVTLPIQSPGQTARSLVSGRRLPTREVEGKLVITVERIVDHEVLVIE